MFDRFDVQKRIPLIRYPNPWREILMSNTTLSNYNKISYKNTEQPVDYKRAVYTRKPARHTFGSSDSIVLYYDDLHVVVLNDDCEWEEFKDKHNGEDVIAFAEVNFG